MLAIQPHQSIEIHTLPFHSVLVLNCRQGAALRNHVRVENANIVILSHSKRKLYQLNLHLLYLTHIGLSGDWVFLKTSCHPSFGNFHPESKCDCFSTKAKWKVVVKLELQMQEQIYRPIFVQYEQSRGRSFQ